LEKLRDKQRVFGCQITIFPKKKDPIRPENDTGKPGTLPGIDAIYLSSPSSTTVEVYIPSIHRVRVFHDFIIQEDRPGGLLITGKLGGDNNDESYSEDDADVEEETAPQERQPSKNVQRSRRIAEKELKKAMKRPLEINESAFLAEQLLQPDNSIGIPDNIFDAQRHPEWNASAQAEVDALSELGTFQEVAEESVPSNCKKIPVKWVFKLKYDEHGNFVKLKSRLCACGNLEEKNSEEVLFAPVIRRESLRLLIDISVQRGFKLHQMDVSNASSRARCVRTINPWISSNSWNCHQAQEELIWAPSRTTIVEQRNQQVLRPRTPT
jgi:hypothetical protein